jgi:hypothetical protein
MQLDEFTKKFLPDYKELFDAHKNEYGWKYNSATYLLLAFSRKYFPEALQKDLRKAERKLPCVF